MKLFISSLLILISVLLYAGVGGEATTRITIAIPTADGFPYIKKEIGQGVVNPGTYVEFLRILEKNLKLEIEIVRYPWKRCLAFLANGEIDGVVSASYKLKREKIGVYPKKNGVVDPSRRFESGDYYLFVKKDSNAKWNGKRFKNLSGVVNAQLGFSVVDFLKGYGVTVNEVASPQKAFELLSSGHGSGAAVHSTIGKVLLEQYPDVKIIQPPLISKPYYLLMSHQIYKEKPAFVEKLWDQVGAIFYSKELAAINKRYLKMKKW